MKKEEIKRYLNGKFSFLKVFNSPFIRPKIKFYIGKLRYGTPYFFPRRWMNNKDKEGWLKAVPKKIGFDFVNVGWKEKYGSIRHEWNPMWSFVFYKLQICIFFVVPHDMHYWESWIYYELYSDKTKSKIDRIKECREKAPQIWSSYSSENTKIIIDYYDLILKKGYENTKSGVSR